MKTICVEASKKYDVLVGNGLLSSVGEICRERIGVCRGVEAGVLDVPFAPCRFNAGKMLPCRDARAKSRQARRQSRYGF